MVFSRDESAIYLASKMAREFTMALQKRAAALGFSPGQFPILIELWHEDGLTQRQLLDRIDVEQATLANTLSRMERDGQRPSAEADRYRLIRRLSLDLIGLPPSLNEIDDFLNDEAPGAYEMVVDRLLEALAPASEGQMWLLLTRLALAQQNP